MFYPHFNYKTDIQTTWIPLYMTVPTGIQESFFSSNREWCSLILLIPPNMYCADILAQKKWQASMSWQMQNPIARLLAITRSWKKSVPTILDLSRRFFQTMKLIPPPLPSTPPLSIFAMKNGMTIRTI